MVKKATPTKHAGGPLVGDVDKRTPLRFRVTVDPGADPQLYSLLRKLNGRARSGRIRSLATLGISKHVRGYLVMPGSDYQLSIPGAGAVGPRRVREKPRKSTPLEVADRGLQINAHEAVQSFSIDVGED